jgi:hypothetical protein
MEKTPHPTEEEERGWDRSAQEAAEAADAASSSLASAYSDVKTHGGEPGRRGPGPVALSALSMLWAVFVAIVVWVAVVFTFDTRTKLFVGANIERALRSAFLGLLLGLLAIGFVRRRRRLLSALLFLEAATLGAALVLVGLDRATYRARFTCDFLCFGPDKPYISTSHVWYLYLLWGLPTVVLLSQAVRVLRESPPQPPKSRYEQPGWAQQPPSERLGEPR